MFSSFLETYKCTNAYCSNGKVNAVCDKCDGKGNYVQSIESNVDINIGKIGYSRKKTEVRCDKCNGKGTIKTNCYACGGIGYINVK